AMNPQAHRHHTNREGCPATPERELVQDDTTAVVETRHIGEEGPRASARDEVLRLRMVADDGGGRLLGLVLPARLLADVDAQPLGAEQARHGGVVLEVGARRVAPRVTTTSVLLPEQTPDGGTVLVDEAPLRPDAP